MKPEYETFLHDRAIQNLNEAFAQPTQTLRYEKLKPFFEVLSNWFVGLSKNDRYFVEDVFDSYRDLYHMCTPRYEPDSQIEVELTAYKLRWIQEYYDKLIKSLEELVIKNRERSKIQANEA
mgnify:CR=1 FL=1